MRMSRHKSPEVILWPFLKAGPLDSPGMTSVMSWARVVPTASSTGMVLKAGSLLGLHIFLSLWSDGLVIGSQGAGPAEDAVVFHDFPLVPHHLSAVLADGLEPWGAGHIRSLYRHPDFFNGK